jgi:hypothetical protein
MRQERFQIFKTTWDWPWICFWKPDPESSWCAIYRWILIIGPVEIRRWR